MDYVEDENGQRGSTSVLCGCSGGAASQVRFAERHIPKPVIINGLTSTGKEKSQESENSGQKKSLQTE